MRECIGGSAGVKLTMEDALDRNLVEQSQSLGDALRTWADEVYQQSRQLSSRGDWRRWMSPGELALINSLIAAHIWTPKEGN